MSTKIGNGYILREDSPGWEDLLRAMITFRKSLVKPINKHVHTIMAIECINRIDRAAVNLPIERPEDSPLSWAYLEFIDRERKIKQTMQRDPVYDLDCEVVLIPIDGKVLGLLYTEQNLIKKRFEALSFVKRYGYWDNTDRPDYVTEVEWNERGKIWDRAIGIEPPAKRGFTIDCSPNWKIPKPANILQLLPTFEKRVLSIATATVRDLFMRDQIGMPNNEVLYKFGQFKEYSKSEEGKKKIEEESKIAKRILKEHLVEGDL